MDSNVTEIIGNYSNYIPEEHLYPDYNYSDYDYSDEYEHHPAQILPPKIIALVLGFFAISLNIMSLLALSQIKNRITTHHRLIISLAVSDMVIGISVVMHFVSTTITVNYWPGKGPPSARLRSWCTVLIIKSLNSTGLNISLLNLMAMAIDHYMAIIRPLHYPSQMNKNNAYIMIAILWILAVTLGFSDFLTGFNVYFKNKPMYNYCEATYLSKYQDEYTIFAITFSATIVMIFIYSRIYRKIQMHRTPGEVNPSNKRLSVRSDFTRNVRALVTTLLILGTFMVCWLPNCIYQIALVILIKINKSKVYEWENILVLLDGYILDLLLLNSIADPVIYAVRMYDVQTGYRRLLKRCIPYSKWRREETSYMGTKLFVDRKTSPVLHEQVTLKHSFAYGNKRIGNSSIKKLETVKDPVSLSGNSSSSCKSAKTTVKSYESNIDGIVAPQ